MPNVNEKAVQVVLGITPPAATYPSTQLSVTVVFTIWVNADTLATNTPAGIGGASRSKQ